MKLESLLIQYTSAQPDDMRTFYRDVVGLPVMPGMELVLLAGDAMVGFDHHSKVNGRATEPERCMLSFLVADVAEETARLKDAGVKCLRDQGREGWGGVISTFLDPDGNIFQFVERPRG